MQLSRRVIRRQNPGVSEFDLKILCLQPEKKPFSLRALSALKMLSCLK
jgi:hypothetical protein